MEMALKQMVVLALSESALQQLTIFEPWQIFSLAFLCINLSQPQKNKKPTFQCGSLIGMLIMVYEKIPIQLGRISSPTP